MEITNRKAMRCNYSDYSAYIDGRMAGRNYYRYGRTLDDVYGSYSSAKAQAYRYCVDLMRDYDGHGLLIMGHNCMTFSVGFIGYINGLKHFFYITRDHDRAFSQPLPCPFRGYWQMNAYDFSTR